MGEPSRRIVIVGGVACGPKAAARARRRDPNAEIILLEKGRFLSYAACGLPYYIGGAVSGIDGLRSTPYGAVRDEVFFQKVKNIDARLGALALSIDRREKKVTARRLDSGTTEEIPYDKLVLATGAVPVIPLIEGINREGVYCLHHPDDALQIRQRIEAGGVERAVIIGAGLVGVELVESLFNHAVDAVVLEMADRVLPSFFDAEMAASIQDELTRDGIEILTSQTALRVEGKGRVEKVVTMDREIAADMVIVAAGVRPNVELARAAGLSLGVTGAIAVDERMRTSGEDIYAGGDCVECFHRVSGRQVYAPLGSTANRHGRVIGENIAGGDDAFPGVVGTVILKALNINAAKTGLTERQALDLGYDIITTITPCQDHVHFYPGNKAFLLKLIAERGTRRLLGAQIVGAGDAAKRIDILATALQFSATLEQAANLDLAYSPPFSHAMDGTIQAANHTRNRLDGLAQGLTPIEARRLLAEAEGLILLDVREAEEIDKQPVGDGRVKPIPQGQLRERSPELNKEATILCLCQQGLRSYEAAVWLKAAGFDKAFYLDGGLRLWPYVSRDPQSRKADFR
ncbi:MAG: FAD-dependent oxidoreductase [Candidatus Omnitrophota bacterium]